MEVRISEARKKHTVVEVQNEGLRKSGSVVEARLPPKRAFWGGFVEVWGFGRFFAVEVRFDMRPRRGSQDFGVILGASGLFYPGSC